MKKCDIKGCKEKATVFLRTLGFCDKHYQEIIGDVTNNALTLPQDYFEKKLEGTKLELIK